MAPIGPPGQGSAWAGGRDHRRQCWLADRCSAPGIGRSFGQFCESGGPIMSHLRNKSRVLPHGIARPKRWGTAKSFRPPVRSVRKSSKLEFGHRLRGRWTQKGRPPQGLRREAAQTARHRSGGFPLAGPKRHHQPGRDLLAQRDLAQRDGAHRIALARHAGQQVDQLRRDRVR